MLDDQGQHRWWPVQPCADLEVDVKISGFSSDAAAMAQLGARTFTETFGHLYTPENLAAFLVNHSEAGWRDEVLHGAIGLAAVAESQPACCRRRR